MNVTLNLVRILSASTTSNPDIAKLYVLVEETFGQTRATVRMSVIADAKLGLTTGQTDLMVNAVVRVRKGQLSVYIANVAARKA